MTSSTVINPFLMWEGRTKCWGKVLVQKNGCTDGSPKQNTSAFVGSTQERLGDAQPLYQGAIRVLRDVHR